MPKTCSKDSSLQSGGRRSHQELSRGTLETPGSDSDRLSFNSCSTTLRRESRVVTLFRMSSSSSCRTSSKPMGAKGARFFGRSRLVMGTTWCQAWSRRVPGRSVLWTRPVTCSRFQRLNLHGFRCFFFRKLCATRLIDCRFPA